MEALQLHAVYKKAVFSLQVTQEFVSVLQVTCTQNVYETETVAAF